jgi:hypothetical protein
MPHCAHPCAPHPGLAALAPELDAASDDSKGTASVAVFIIEASTTAAIFLMISPTYKRPIIPIRPVTPTTVFFRNLEGKMAKLRSKPAKFPRAHSY